jgi:subtilase family serine protease
MNKRSATKSEGEKFMKRSIALSTIAAAVLFLAFASSTQVALAQNGDRYIVPESSIERPGDAGVRAHTNIILVLPGKGEIGNNGAPIAENPLSLACIYHLVKQTKGCPKTSTVVPTGGTNAIALVDAFDNPDAVNDLKTFAAAYGYGTPNFTVVKVGNPSPNQGWALEESLDIEYAFGMAPNAHIYLVEANSNSDADLDAAEDKATALLQAAGGGEASNSWGEGEFSGEKSEDSHFQGTGVVYFASSGDSGGQVIYPSASPFVVSVGGTTILRNSKGLFTSESAWSDAGGGPSSVEPRPSYQKVIKSIVGAHRGTPDFSSEASNVSYVAIYSQYGCGGWCGVGGTSVSSPTMAGIVNAAGKFNTSTKAEDTEAYKDYANATKYKADWNDITTGSNRYACKKGWEFCTGIGSPHTYKGK